VTKEAVHEHQTSARLRLIVAGTAHTRSGRQGVAKEQRRSNNCGQGAAKEQQMCNTYEELRALGDELNLGLDLIRWRLLEFFFAQTIETLWMEGVIYRNKSLMLRKYLGRRHECRQGGGWRGHGRQGWEFFQHSTELILISGGV